MVYLFHRHPYLETKINAATIISVTAFLFGGDEGIRTPDLCVANASLYQLSHAPKAVLIIHYFLQDCKSKKMKNTHFLNEKISAHITRIQAPARKR